MNLYTRYKKTFRSILSLVVIFTVVLGISILSTNTIHAAPPTAEELANQEIYTGGSFSEYLGVFAQGTKGSLISSYNYLVAPVLTLGGNILNYYAGTDADVDASMTNDVSDDTQPLIERARDNMPAMPDFIMEYVAKTLYALSELIFVISRGIYDLAGYLINNLMNFSLENKGISMSVIGSTWALVRDFANLSLIFTLLYISISTVLGLNGANTYKMLGKLVLVGLLLNFSLIFTEVVIDTSNIVAIQFKNEIGIGKNHNFSAMVTKSLGLEKATGAVDATQDTADLNYFNMTLATLGVSIFFLFAAFTLFSGAGMFLVRIIKLAIIMILSPLAFVAIIIPKFERAAGEWAGELFGNAFFAPAYLFMLYISMSVIIKLSALQTATYQSSVEFLIKTGVTNAATEMSTAQLLTSFVIAIALLQVSVLVAAQVGGKTAEQGKKLAGTAFGTAVGAGAALGRQTGGRYGQQLYEKYANDNSTFGKIARGTGDIMRKGTWDVRNAPVAGAAIEQAAGQAGVSTKEGLVFKDAQASAGGYTKLGGALSEYTTLDKATGGKISKYLGGPGTDTIAKEKREEKERTDTVRKLKTEGIIKKLEDPSSGMTDKDIQDEMKNLRMEEKLELFGDDVTDPKVQHLLRNADKKTLGALEAKQDENGKKHMMNTVMAHKDANGNAINKSGANFYRVKAGKIDIEAKLAQAKIDMTSSDNSVVTAAKAQLKNLAETMEDDIAEELDNEFKTFEEFAQHFGEAQLPTIMKSLKTNSDRKKVGTAIQGNHANRSGNAFLHTDLGRVLRQ